MQQDQIIRVITVVGARPQFVKAAVVSAAMKATGHIEEILVHTGQHYDDSMSGVFFRQLGIPEPQINLAVGSGGHGAQTGRMLEKLEQVLIEASPDWVLVYGDTNSTLAGSLAASKLGIKVAHVEAGLRSYNRSMPEEINRVLTDCISDILFTPTNRASENLRKEGYAESKIQQVGDVMYDAALYFGKIADQQSTLLDDINIQHKNYILATIHRADNTASPEKLENIFISLEEISKKHTVIVPIHPRTRKAMHDFGIVIPDSSTLRVIDPVSYLDMLSLEKNSKCIITDSGGVQKESFFFDVPCVVLRTETEWIELLESGHHLLAPPVSPTVISDKVFELLEKSTDLNSLDIHPYGDGNAAGLIAAILAK